MTRNTIIKSFKSKKGNDVVFRYTTPEDLDDMLSYINEIIAEDTYIGIFGDPLTREEEEKHHNENLQDVQKGDKRFIVVEINGKYRGNAGVHREKTRRKKYVGTMGISLAKDFRDEGIGHELMKTLIDEAKSLGLRILTLTCMENNPRALHLYEKVGFTRAGFIPNAMIWKNGFVGEIILYLPLENKML